MKTLKAPIYKDGVPAETEEKQGVPPSAENPASG